MPLLEVQDLKTHFFGKRGVTKAVDGVSFTLNRGEILGIVGESGSGKSVTSLSIMRLVDHPGRVVGGSIHFEGRDLLQLSRDEMRKLRGERMSMIFQEPGTSMNPVLTVGFQIAEAIRSHQRVPAEQVRARTIELLAMVGIPDPEKRLRQFPHQFSGGMLQRLMIAMGLALTPSLLIADEPVTALDVTIQAQILDLLKELRDTTDAAVLLITHDMGVVAETCDRVVVMYLGVIVEEAPVGVLFENPQHPYTQGLLGSIPSIDHKVEWLEAIPGMIPNPTDIPQGCRFSNRCPKVMAACHEVEPQLLETAAGHRVACHLYAPSEEVLANG
jgi:oligopeptide/dipeptide ABC transporter ATP-binding protein